MDDQRKHFVSGILTAMGSGGSGGASYKLYKGSRLTDSNLYGFSAMTGVGLFGSLSPTNFLNSVINRLYWDESIDRLSLSVANPSVANSGWTTLRIGSTDFARSAATYGSGIWRWVGISSNPFSGVDGTMYDVTIVY